MFKTKFKKEEKKSCFVILATSCTADRKGIKASDSLVVAGGGLPRDDDDEAQDERDQQYERVQPPPVTVNSHNNNQSERHKFTISFPGTL